MSNSQIMKYNRPFKNASVQLYLQLNHVLTRVWQKKKIMYTEKPGEFGLEFSTSDNLSYSYLCIKKKQKQKQNPTIKAV